MADLRVVRPRARKAPEPAIVEKLESSLIAGLVLAPDSLARVREGLRVDDFLSGRCGTVYQTLLRLEAVGFDFSTLLEELDRQEDLPRVGGEAGLCEILDASATGAMVEEYARRVRRLSLERKERALLAEGVESEPDRAALGEIARALDRLEIDASKRQLQHPIGLVGDGLRALRERVEPESPLPGFLDPEPGLHLLAGRPKRGKTTLGLYLAMCWACGASPWRGAPPFPGGRALVISREQSAGRVERRARSLDLCHTGIDRDTWTDRVSIVARDRELAPMLTRLMLMDQSGLDFLAMVLETAPEPYGFVLLDSLSRLKGPEAEENDNDAMTAFLDPLQALAEQAGVYILLVHHAPKQVENVRNSLRGAGAIEAIPQALWVVDEGDQPTSRKVTTWGNAIGERVWNFSVAPEQDADKILFWRLEDLGESFPVEDHIASGETLTLRELSARLFDQPDHQRQRERAKAVAYNWQRAGLVEVHKPERRGQPFEIRRTGGPAGPSGEDDDGDLPF